MLAFYSNLWTWDDWLVEARSRLSSTGGNDEGATTDDDDGTPALHVILESAVPPCEVELCRDLMPHFEFTQAADCMRCLSEDSDGSEIDAYDPAADGFGSYMDYVHRRLLEVERSGNGDYDRFLHCVDCRDLGCEPLVNWLPFHFLPNASCRSDNLIFSNSGRVTYA